MRLTDGADLRRTVRVVAILNLAYFAVEFVSASSIGSVSLFADSVDFLEDASVNFLILVALGWSVRKRARVGMLLAGVLVLPALAGFWMAYRKLVDPVPPEPFSLSVVGLGALAVNSWCAFLLVRYRDHSGSLTRAAYLSARNDILANLAIIASGLVTLALPSAWPDLLVGIGIGWMNADASREVFRAARAEHRAATPDLGHDARP